MKKLLVIFLLFTVAAYAKAQDAYAKDLPEYTTVANDSTDVLYIDDSGIDKHIEMPTLIKLVSDSTNQLRQELDTAKTAIRSEIAGGGAWSATGDVVSLTSTNDTVDIGVTQISKLILDDGTTFGSYSSPTWSHGIRGNVYLYNNMRFGDFGQKLYFGSDAYIQLTDSYPWQELEFHDNVSGTRKLSDLIAGGTGDLSVRGTVTQYQVPYFYSDLTSVEGNSGLKYKPDEYFYVDIITAAGVDNEGIEITDNSAILQTYTPSTSATVGIVTGSPVMSKTASSVTSSIIIDGDGYVIIDSGTGKIQFDTTIYYTGAGTLKTTYGWMYIDSTNNQVLVDSSVVSASYGLRMPMKNIFRYYFDRKDGELVWHYQTDSLTIERDYGVLTGNEPPARTIEKLIVAIEHIYRRIFRMSLLFIILFGWVIYQQYQIRKIKSKNYLILNK